MNGSSGLFNPSRFAADFSLDELIKNLKSSAVSDLIRTGMSSAGGGVGSAAFDKGKPFVTTKSATLNLIIETEKLHSLMLSDILGELVTAAKDRLRNNNFNALVEWSDQSDSKPITDENQQVEIGYESKNVAGEILFKAAVNHLQNSLIPAQSLISISVYLVESSYSLEWVETADQLPNYIPTGKYYVVGFPCAEHHAAQNFYDRIATLAEQSIDEFILRVKNYPRGEEELDRIVENFNLLVSETVELAMYRYQYLPECRLDSPVSMEINPVKLLPSAYEPLTIFYFFNQGILQMLLDTEEKPHILKTVSAAAVARLNERCYGGRYLSKARRAEFYQANNL